MKRSCCLFCCFVLTLSAPPHILPAQTSSQPRSAPNYAGCHEMNRLRHWTHFPLRVYLAPGRLNTPDRLAQMDTGFGEWVSATGGVICYRKVTTEAGADICIRISSQISLPQDARSLGQTVLNYDGDVMTHADIQLVEREDDPAQFQEICAHEFGHALGIDGHSDDPHDMMFPVLSHSLFQVHNAELEGLIQHGSVTARDVATLAIAYPALVFPSRASPAKKH
jgi:hypothetical protein